MPGQGPGQGQGQPQGQGPQPGQTPEQQRAAQAQQGQAQQAQAGPRPNKVDAATLERQAAAVHQALQQLPRRPTHGAGGAAPAGAQHGLLGLAGGLLTSLSPDVQAKVGRFGADVVDDVKNLTAEGIQLVLAIALDKAPGLFGIFTGDFPV